MKKLLLAMGFLIILFSCEEIENSFDLIEAPEQITNKALEYALKYKDADTEYYWGGRDYLRSIKIDCSGLVLRTYQYAVNGTQYTLPFQNATVNTFFNQWTVIIEDPRPGDIIFMGDDKNNPTHMSIFVENKEDYIYFIDSTLKPDENIDGVSERSYLENDSRFLSFGRLLVQVKSP